MNDKLLQTNRLKLRPWRDSDLPAYAAMNADPRVMEFYPSVYSRDESEKSFGRIREHFCVHGYGLWAVEISGIADFVGFVGLQHVPYLEHLRSAVEIGWRLSFDHWGKGYATEAARKSLEYAFVKLQLPEVVAMTTPANLRSRHVMKKLGMTRSPADDFDHPKIQEGHPLRRHVLYRLQRDSSRII